VAPPVATLVPGEPSSAEFYPETLPNVAITEVMGLLEAVADKGGRTNIFDLALRTGKEFGRTLYLVKAAEIFDLVDTPKQDIILTDSGKRFVSGDINVRKQMLHDLFPSLHIVQMVTTMLRIQSGLKMPIDELSVCFQEWLPNENPNEVIQALIGWGRFAEYFGYNDDTKEFYLDVGQDK
jgi:NitT/TauT family transport system ATP-binding protein